MGRSLSSGWRPGRQPLETGPAPSRNARLAHFSVALAVSVVHLCPPMSDQNKANMTMRLPSWFIAAAIRRGNSGYVVSTHA